MFKGKVGVQYEDPVTVSVRQTFSVKNFLGASYNSKRQYAFSDRDDDEDNSRSDDSFSPLPFGVSVDPVTELILYCSWPKVAENVVVDSQTYSDFEAMLAPIWSIRTRYEKMPICFMSECLTEYLQLSESTRSISELLGEAYTYGGTEFDEKNPFEKLTESKISSFTSSVLPSLKSSTSSSKQDSKKKNDGPMSEEQLMNMLYYMFPDAQTGSPHSYDIPDNDSVGL